MSELEQNLEHGLVFHYKHSNVRFAKLLRLGAFEVSLPGCLHFAEFVPMNWCIRSLTKRCGNYHFTLVKQMGQLAGALICLRAYDGLGAPNDQCEARKVLHHIVCT